MKTLFFIILMVGCLGQISSDIYAPALPAVALSLGVKITAAQLSMTIFLFFLAFSQLIYGPLSEGLGRRMPLFIGLSLYIVGTIICILSTNITLLITGRIIQGLGAGATAALWRAIFRDMFSGDRLSKYGSYFGIAITFVIPAAPALGGFLNHYSHWDSIFIFLLCYAVATLILTMTCYKETSTLKSIDRLKLSFITSSFKELLTNKNFIGTALASFMTYGAFFSWFTVGPVLLIQNAGMTSVHFGLICLVTSAVAMTLGSFVNAKFVETLGGNAMLGIGWSIMVCAGLVMLLSQSQTTLIIASVAIMYFGATLIWPNLFSKAFTPFGHIAGYAAALYSCFQLGGGAILGTLCSHLPHATPTALSCVFISAPIIAALIYINLNRTQTP